MVTVDVDDVTSKLEGARVSPSGVSFAGQALKLNSEEDAKPVVEAINNCKALQFLNLEGNTLGVDASKAIAGALESHPEFKRALWKDMFTGRMKSEIPQALQFLGNGLVTAGSRLTELDLSDNAFGPIGVEGLASLLRSSSCYALEELRLNNNGLGIGGGQLLAGALLDCYKFSQKEGKPLALKVFIAGRNRLENDGAKALAEVFKTIGTLEEIAMPQNGIYHVGITALSDAFKNNPNLQILNLNDNTIGSKGSKAIAAVLPYLKNLKEINFGDCLLKNKGAISLADGLRHCAKLEQLFLGFNEIRIEGALELLKALSNKEKLISVVLDGNQFGDGGVNKIKSHMKSIGKINTLGSLSEDENPSESEDDSDGKESEEESESEEDDDDDENGYETTTLNNVTVVDFLQKPTSENFLALGVNPANLLHSEAQKNNKTYVESVIIMIMKVGSLSVCKSSEVCESALNCTDQLYQKLFAFSNQDGNFSNINNCLLVNLGLIKSEDKIKPTWNIDGCLQALHRVLKKNYLPDSTKDTLRVFLQKDVINAKEFLSIKRDILAELK